jgi:ABC-2 type transport system permease protein
MAVTLSAMGVGFGALFPRFEMENVAQIQTSPGGLLFMVTALFYVGATLALEAVLMRGHYFSGRGLIRSDESLYAMAALAALNVAAFTIPLLLGKSHLDRADL